MILKSHCPYCKERRLVAREQRDINGITRTFDECHHIERITFAKASDFADIRSSDGKTLRPFQADGAAFTVNSGGRCLIADECGLGKTVQAEAFLTRRGALPALVICKAGLKMQWMRETHRWTGNIGQTIVAESDLPLGFQVCFISMDLLYRFKDIPAFAAKFAFRTIILDECQAIKNHDSKRTNAIRRLASHVPNFIALSGTPIKNHAGEYFPILNILRPDLFPTLAGFYSRWTDTYYNGYSMKTGGLKDAAAFADYTKDFIIRRTKAEVMKDLPRIERVPLFSELGKDVEKAYAATLREFTDYYDDPGRKPGIGDSSCILAYLTKMRHLTGLSKINSVVDQVEDFLTSNTGKIVIFLHHKDVSTLLTLKLNELCLTAPLTLESKHTTLERQDIIDTFQRGSSRVLVASTLAAGEGVDGIQNVCDTIIIMERQWNPANEEQVEGRIERMGQGSASLTAIYPIATGTVDEFFAEIVERKRSYVSNTLDGVEIKWDESSIMKELCEALSASGKKRWSW